MTQVAVTRGCRGRVAGGGQEVAGGGEEVAVPGQQLLQGGGQHAPALLAVSGRIMRRV